MLGRQADLFENWGLCGAGNSYVLLSLIECHQRHGIQQGDRVYIMWTNTSREDRYVKNRWIEGGNVYWEGHPLGAEYVRRWSCERGYLIRDLATITATRHLLDSWQCDWRFFSMVPLARTNSENCLGEHPSAEMHADLDVREFYQDTLACIRPSVLEVIFQGDWNSRSGIPDANNPDRRDFHPTPAEHLEYIRSVAPDVSLCEDTVDWMMSRHRQAAQGNLSWGEQYRPLKRL